MAPSFNVVGRFVADVSNFMRGVTQVGRASKDLSREMDENARMVRKLQQESERVTVTMGKLRQAQQQFVDGSHRATEAIRQESAALTLLAKGYRDLDEAQRTASQRSARTAQNAAQAGRAAGGSSLGRTIGAAGVAGASGLGIYKLLQSISDKGVGSTATGVGKGFESIGAGAMKAAMGIKDATAASAGWAKQKGAFGVINASLDQAANSVQLLRMAYFPLIVAVDLATNRLLSQEAALARGRGIENRIKMIQAATSRFEQFASAYNRIGRMQPGANPLEKGLAAFLGTGKSNLIQSSLIGVRDRMFEVSRGLKFGLIRKFFGDMVLGADNSVKRLALVRSAFTQLGDVAGGMVVFSALQQGVQWMGQFARETVSAGGRVKELNVVLDLMGQKQNQSSASLRMQTEELKGLGIETKQAQAALAQFMRQGFSTKQASKLADVARNAAIFSQEDTTATLERLIWGVQTRQIEVLRTAGVNVSFEREFANVAAQAKKNVNELTEQEKMQAALNAVLREGERITGAYEMAMETANKQLRSTPRYLKEIQNAVGVALEPAFAAAVHTLNSFVTGIGDLVKGQSAVTHMVGGLADAIAKPFDTLDRRIQKMFNGTSSAALVGRAKSMFAQMEQGVPVLSGIGAGLATNFTAQIGGLGNLLIPLKPYQAAIGAMVLTSKELRGVLGALIDDFAGAGAILSSSVLPAFNRLGEFLSENSVVLEELAKDLGTFLEVQAKSWATAIDTATMALGPLSTGVNGLLTALDKMNVLSAAGIFGKASYYGAVTASLVPMLGGLAAKAALVGVVFSKQGREMMGAVNNFAKVAKSGGDMNAAMAQLVPASRQFGAEAATGVTRYFRWMNVIAKTVGIIQVAVFALTLGLQVYSWWQRRVQERQEKMLAGVKSYYDAIAAKSSAHRAMSMLTTDMQKLNEQYVEATARAKELSEPQKVRQTIDIQRTTTGNNDKSIEEYATRALMVDRAISDNKEEAKELVRSAAVAKAARDARMTIFKREYDTYAKTVHEFAGEQKRAVAESKASVEESAAAVSALIGKNAEGLFTAMAPTPQQAQAIEDQLSQIVQSTQEWSEKAVSFSEALLRKEVKSSEDLRAHYHEMRARIEYFWTDIAYLQSRGLNQAAISDLVAKGPLQIGDALGKLRDEMEGQTASQQQATIADINNTAGAIADYSQSRARALAEQILTGSDALANLSEIESATLAKELKRLQRDQLSGREGAQGALDVILTQATKNMEELERRSMGKGKDWWNPFGKASDYVQRDTGPIDEYKATVSEALAVLSDGRSSAQEAAQAYADALSIGEKMKASDPTVKPLVDDLNTLIEVMRSRLPQMQDAGDTLGVAIGENVALGVRNTAIPGVEGALNDVMQRADISLSTMVAKAAAAGAAAAAYAGDITQMQHGSPWRGIDLISDGGVKQIEAEHNARMAQIEAQAAEARKALETKPEYGRPPLSEMGGTDMAALESAANDAGKSLAEIADDVRKANPPLQLFGEALDKVADNMRSFRMAVDGSDDAAEGLAGTLLDLAGSTDRPAKQARILRGEVDRLISSIRSETEAAAKSGAIAEDVGVMTRYMKDRLGELKGSLPGLVDELMNSAKAAEVLEDRISKARETLAKGLDIKINASEAAMDAEDAMDTLRQAVLDQRQLLTGVHLGEKDRRDIHKGIVRPLNQYVQALEDEAEAMARNGEISADAASMQDHIRKGLVALGAEFPELAKEVETYTKTLTAVPEEVDTKTKLKADIEAAMRQIDDYTALLDQVPGTAETLLQVKIDEAAMEEAKRQLDSLKNYAPIYDPFGMGGGGEGESAPAAALAGVGMDAKDMNPGGVYRQSGPVPPSVPQSSMRATPMGSVVRSNKEASATFKQLVQDATRQAVALAQAGRIGEDWSSIQRAVVVQLKAQIDEMPELQGMLNDYVATVESVPANQLTTFKADTVGAQSAVESFATVVQTFPAAASTTITATINGGEDVAWLAGALGVTTGSRTLVVTADTSQARAEMLALNQLVADNFYLAAAANFNGQQKGLMNTLTGQGFGAPWAAWFVATGQRMGQGTRPSEHTNHVPLYDSGGWLKPGQQVVNNATGVAEWVMNPQQMKDFMAMTGTGSMEAALGVAASLRSSVRTANSAPGADLVSGGPMSEPRQGAGRWDDLLVAIDRMGSKQGVVIQKMEVTSDEPSDSWFDSGMWRTVNRVIGNA